MCYYHSTLYSILYIYLYIYHITYIYYRSDSYSRPVILYIYVPWTNSTTATALLLLVLPLLLLLLLLLRRPRRLWLFACMAWWCVPFGMDALVFCFGGPFVCMDALSCIFPTNRGFRALHKSLHAGWPPYGVQVRLESTWGVEANSQRARCE